MFSQEDIDAVLQDAQSAVDDLSRDVSGLATGRGATGTAVAEQPTRTATAVRTKASTHAAKSSKAPNVQRILKLKVPVRVLLAQRYMSVGDILKMAPGSIVEFVQDVEDELSLLANNQKIGAGVAVKVNEHFGLRITTIGDVQSRIQSLGS
jgi:flagellar motor switch/type III secretory pathway protein FliN